MIKIPLRDAIPASNYMYITLVDAIFEWIEGECGRMRHETGTA
jgi:hypothetical protein